ncbi:MAG: hypothetical protein WCX64_03920 [Candidatus Micrarchaeia archaeon]|jgi:hypothetical protein
MNRFQSQEQIDQREKLLWVGMPIDVNGLVTNYLYPMQKQIQSQPEQIGLEIERRLAPYFSQLITIISAKVNPEWTSQCIEIGNYYAGLAYSKEFIKKIYLVEGTKNAELITFFESDEDYFGREQQIVDLEKILRSRYSDTYCQIDFKWIEYNPDSSFFKLVEQNGRQLK